MIIPNELQVFRPSIPKTQRQLREEKYPVSTPVYTEQYKEPIQTMPSKKRYIVSALGTFGTHSTQTVVSPYTPEQQEKITATENILNQLKLEIQREQGLAEMDAKEGQWSSYHGDLARKKMREDEYNAYYNSLYLFKLSITNPEQFDVYAPPTDPLIYAAEDLAQRNRERAASEEQTRRLAELQQQAKQEAIQKENISIISQQKINPPLQQATQKTTMSLTDFKRLIQGEDINTFLLAPRLQTKQVSLPYQKRGTSYYSPDKGYYTPTTTVINNSFKPKSFLSFTEDVIEYPYTFLVDIPEKKAKEKEKQNLFIYEPVAVSRKETVSYAPKTLSVGGQIEKERIKTEQLETFKVETIAQDKVNKIYDKYTTQIINQTKDKSMSEEAFNKIVKNKQELAEKEANIEVNTLLKKYEGEYTTREKERAKDLVNREFKEEFFQRRIKDVVRAGLYAVPYYGQVLAAKDVTKTVLSTPDIAKEFYRNPLQTGVETASSIAIFGSVGAAKGKIKGTIEQPKIKEAIEKGTFISRVTKGKITETDMYWSKLNEQGKQELSKLLSENKSVREVEVTLKPKEGMEKYTPEVKGKYLEYVNEQGEVIKSIPVGKVELRYKGKVVGEKIYGETIGELNKETGKVTTVSDIVSQPYRKTFLGREKLVKQPTVSRYLSETDLLNLKQEGKQTAVKTQSTTFLRSTEKYKGKKLLDIPTEYKKDNSDLINYEAIKRESKPITKSENIEVQSLKRTEGLRIGDDKGSTLFTRKLYEVRKGLGESKRIIEKVKTKKEFKSIKDIYKEPPKPTSRFINEKPNSFKETKISEPTTTGLVYESKYQGKQFKLNVSPVADILGYGSSEGLSKGLVSRGIGGGLIGGFLGLTKMKPEEKRGVGLNKFEIDISKDINVSKPKDFITPKDIIKTDDSFKPIDIFKPKEEGLYKPKEELNIRSGNLSATYPTQVEIAGQRTDTKQGFDYGKPSTPRTPTTPKTPIFKFPEEIIKPFDDYQRKNKQIEQQGYDAYAYIDATKQRKAYYKKLNEQPLTKESALSLASREVDNTISAKGKVIKSKPKIINNKKVVEKPIDTNDNYFEVNRNKFRTYQQRQGAKTKLPNSFIERQKYRLDKSGETKNITSAKRFNIRNAFGI